MATGRARSQGLWASLAMCASVALGVGLFGAPAQAASGGRGLHHGVGLHNATYSGNWAGYVDIASTITSVEGSFIVPNAGTLPPGVSATWVGIGGYGTSDLIQAGTQQISSPFGQFFAGGSYAAWYEMLPANPV
ncbi:MAG: G1 family glutamic endopeptidase, partial [Acidimicrobiales bacterium]